MEEEAYYAERRAAAAVARQQRATAAAAVTSSHRPGDPLSVTLTPCDAKGDWSDVELDDEAFEAAEKEARAKEGHHGRGHGLSGDLRPTDSEEFLRRASTGAGPPASAHNRLLQQRLNQGKAWLLALFFFAVLVVPLPFQLLSCDPLVVRSTAQSDNSAPFFNLKALYE